MEDYSDLVNRLKDFNVNYHAGGEEEEAPAAAPVAVGMERGAAAAAGLLPNDPLEARIQAFLQREPVILTPRPNFNPILWLSPTMFQPEVTDFKDDVFLHRPAVTLKKLDSDTLAAIGRVTIPQIRAGFTYRGVGSLFVLAYNLHDPKDGTNICVDLDGEEFDKDIDDLSGDQRLYRVDYAPLPATRNVDKEAQEYCFIAASLLRLFAKPEENYIKSFTQIISGYRRFFHGCGMITSPPAPTLAALRTLKFYFSSSDLFKMTLFRFLYSGGGVEKAVGMRRFLYENYLVHTGMHIVGIAEKLVEVLGCSPELLMEAVYDPQYEHELNRLAIMFELAGRDDDDEEHKRQMWRFGRVFDHNFMESLRTKSCALLAFVLASALKKEDPDSNRDILSIVHFSDLSEEMKRKADAVATMALRNIRATLMANKD